MQPIVFATCLAEKDLPRFRTLARSLRRYSPQIEHHIICENNATFDLLTEDYAWQSERVFELQSAIFIDPKLESKWHLQMLLKLFYTRRLCGRATNVMWLDADTFLINDFKYTDLLTADGRIKQRWDDIWCKAWAEAIAAIIGLRPLRQPHVVAPVLNTEICTKVLAWLTSKFEEPWYDALVTHSNNRILWTEYLLYFVVSQELGLYNSYYESVSQGLTGAGFNLSDRKPFNEIDWNARWKQGGTFVVAESNTNVNPEDVLTKWYEWSMSLLPEETLLL